MVGPKHVRLKTFIFSPQKVIEYFKGILRGSGPKYVGHNPGSAYASLAMFVLIILLAITGVMIGLGNESAEDLHEFLAYIMLFVVLAHISGVVLYSLRHKENIAASMIHGKKTGDEKEGISSSHPLTALVFLILTGGWALGLIANYNPATVSTRLPLLGTQIHLGEIEEKEHQFEERNREELEKDYYDEDDEHYDDEDHDIHEEEHEDDD
ncbi:cytochrome b/b6 domain-containing protein [Thermodesulfatator indicus]|uniref:cytochrome b/b6 domain-containing protein n=1 Tax=Thermodesulfatator indicus TaxID=171695 RepID=UPI000313BE27|nr:cytochrome b/b6 domain-containing protein [Thermodesulfatator indicus]